MHLACVSEFWHGATSGFVTSATVWSMCVWHVRDVSKETQRVLVCDAAGGSVSFRQDADARPSALDARITRETVTERKPGGRGARPGPPHGRRSPQPPRRAAGRSASGASARAGTSIFCDVDYLRSPVPACRKSIWAGQMFGVRSVGLGLGVRETPAHAPDRSGLIRTRVKTCADRVV